MVYPALLPLIRTPRLPAVDWTDPPADLNRLVRFAERRNMVSARVPSRFKRSLCVSRTMSKHYMQTTAPQSTRLAVRDLSTFNYWVYNKHTQLIFIFSKTPTPPLGPTHLPSQWVQTALPSARKSPGSEPILTLPHPPSWRSCGLLYLYYEMIPDYLSRRIKTRHCQIWSHIIIITSRQQQDNVICLMSVSVNWSFLCLISCFFFLFKAWQMGPRVRQTSRRPLQTTNCHSRSPTLAHR